MRNDTQELDSHATEKHSESGELVEARNSDAKLNKSTDADAEQFGGDQNSTMDVLPVELDYAPQVVYRFSNPLPRRAHFTLDSSKPT